MSTMEMMGSDGTPRAVDAAKVGALRGAMRGALLRPGDAGYEDARTVWNAMIDRRPALIARCTGAADVMLAVDFARDHGVLLAVRGGGHNIAGKAVCDGGLMIDLSPMKFVHVDAERRTAHVGPGATLADLDHETQAFGLAVPVGINSTTGVAGLTLGGGFGWLSRKHGMTIDNLVAADVVTADGRLVRASAGEHPDLFWALRGGGGNFGVVTRFEFRLHPVGPSVLAGLVVYPLEQARAALARYRDFASTLPDETAVWAVMRKAPPLPFLPPEVHGREVLIFAMFHGGDVERGQAILDPVRRFGTPVGEHVGVQPLAAWQAAFDPLLVPGARNYWKSHNFATLDDGFLDIVVDQLRRLPSTQTEVFIGQLGGAMARVAPNATAYPGRNAAYVMNVHGRWDNASEDAAGIAWCRRLFEAAAPYATGEVYVNFLTEDEADRVPNAFGPNLQRLAQVKAAYDPQNLFHVNHNVRPVPSARAAA
ncbi:MAG TPA: FAD-binding oxidoreductase [Casimicrobiaceae bacterium]|nr:FAD-binding oxidoreductase [Casimicrobiaceae bacterium]